MSLMNDRKKRGPRSEPCGTPEGHLKRYDFIFLYTAYCILLLKYDSMSSTTVPMSPKYFNFRISILWLPSSKLFESPYKQCLLCALIQILCKKLVEAGHIGVHPFHWKRTVQRIHHVFFNLTRKLYACITVLNIFAGTDANKAMMGLRFDMSAMEMLLGTGTTFIICQIVG